MPVAEAQPADARRQSLERDALAGHVEPAVQVRVVGEELAHLPVGPADVLRVARERDPAERPLPFAEQRADVRGHESGERERVRHAFVLRHLADVVAVVERRHALAVERQHRLDVHRGRALGRAREVRVLRRIGLRGAPALDRPTRGQVSVDEVVRGRLVGHHVGTHAALHELGNDLGRVAEEAYRTRLARGARATDAHERVVEVAGLLVEVARREAHLDARWLALNR